MRRAARIDGNQKKLVKQCRKAGMTVAHTHMIGKGFPDIVVGYRGRNELIEIKDPDKPPSKKKLTPDEVEWHNNWRGSVHVCETIDDVLAIFEE